MSATEIYRNIIGASDGDPMRHVGCLFDWKTRAAATAGAFSLVEIEAWRGCEPPLHYHTREDEFFYLLEGEAVFRVGEETRRIGPGGFVWAPRDVPHGFAFLSERARLLVGLLPGGHEDVFDRFSAPDPQRRPAAEPAAEELPDLAALEAADREAGVVYVGPPLRELLECEPAGASEPALGSPAR